MYVLSVRVPVVHLTRSARKTSVDGLPAVLSSTSSFYSSTLLRAKMCGLVLYCITAFKLQMNVTDSCLTKPIPSVTFDVRGYQT